MSTVEKRIGYENCLTLISRLSESFFTKRHPAVEPLAEQAVSSVSRNSQIQAFTPILELR